MEGNGIIKSVHLDGVRGTADSFRLMNGIIRDMKEIPELPSERPSDVNQLVRVDYPREGGLLTYMSGNDYPYRGFPHFEVVEKIDFLKKISRGLLSGLYHSLKDKRLKLLTLLPSAWLAKSAVRAILYTYARLVERSRVKPFFYSKCVRELYRAFTSCPESELRDQVRDLLCMVVEFDNAYRYRVQDVLPELNKKKLQQNPVKETTRLLGLMISREKTQEIKDTWRLGKLAVQYLRFDRPLLKLIKEALGELELEEIGLTTEDKFYCVPRKDYNFGFLQNPSLVDQGTIQLARLAYEKNLAMTELGNQFRDQMEKKQIADAAERDRLKPLDKAEFEQRSAQIAKQSERLDQEYNEKLKSIYRAQISPEQQQLLDKQNKENEDAVADYNARLKELDENYAQRRLTILNVS